MHGFNKNSKVDEKGAWCNTRHRNKNTKLQNKKIVEYNMN